MEEPPQLVSKVQGRNFNGTLRIIEGWYWLLPARDLRSGRAQAVNLMGRELVAYRTQAGEAVVMDAFCPHMGCHLALGAVDGDCIRCFFHNWAFRKDGQCVDVPTLNEPPKVRTRTWPCQERHGMLWVWTGPGEPDHEIPEPVELAGTEYESARGKRFAKKCHPNVVMINAIDEQHFRTVHRVPGHLLHMEPQVISRNQIHFANNAPKPDSTPLLRFFARFYAGPIRYHLTYWYGSNGIVTLGPDFLHLYIMFALRQTPEGGTEGQTLVFTPKRRGPLGWLANRIILWITQVAGNYFSVGDTKVFQSIRFNYRTPVPADQAVQAFMRHLEKQPVVPWAEESHDAKPV